MMKRRNFDRRVLKWLQSLHLPPFPNPRVDFANGYLVALIFAAYYPNQIQLPCLYATCTSELLKLNNWFVLQKFFEKVKVQIPKDAIEAVRKCQEGAAIQFVENLYTLLTKNEVYRAPTEAMNTFDIVPHFQLPTTTNAIRCMADNPTKVTSTDKAQVVLEAHTEFLHQLRQKRKEKVVLKPVQEIQVRQ